VHVTIWLQVAGTRISACAAAHFLSRSWSNLLCLSAQVTVENHGHTNGHIMSGWRPLKR